ncbi:hypothetical protein D3C81_1166790 [compost metagenome]
MLPARTLRVLQICAISWPKSNTMSVPQSGWPTFLLFQCTVIGKCTLRSRQASPSSSGVTATGENAVAGLLWKKPKPLPSSAGIRLRNDTSLASSTRRMASPACSGVAPIFTSPVMTATSASKSMPKASLAHTMSSCGPRKSSEPPWYISGSVQNSGGISAPRALRTSSTWLT